MHTFNSYRECREEIFEIRKILKYLKDGDVPENIYSTLCNGNVIVLGTLFECFTENIIQEYVDILTVEFNNRRLNYSKLPDGCREYISKSVLANHHKREFSSATYSQIQKAISKFLVCVSDDGFTIDKELDGINRFSFGRHGENEVRKTLCRIGVDINDIVVEFDDLNNFFNLRNGLVHPESISLTKTVPPDITTIKKNLILLYKYVKAVNTHLQKELTRLST